MAIVKTRPTRELATTWTGTRLPPSLKTRLDRLARDCGMTAAETLRSLIEHAVVEHMSERRPVPRARFE